jgi:lipoprotein-releasing system permease protein
VSNAASAVERWLAWRYLATRQREGFVSVIAMFSLIGVALGVATLIVVLSVMGGFREQLLSRIIGMNGHVIVMTRDGVLQATPEMIATLKATPDVKAVRVTLERQALVTANGQTRGVSLRGVRFEDLVSREVVMKNMVMGDPAAFGTRGGVVIGDRLRQGLNLRIGDPITLVTQKLNANGTIAPRYADYEVLGTFTTNRYEYDASLVFVPIDLLQEDLEYGPQAATSIDLELRDANDAPQVAETLRKTLDRKDLRVTTWLESNARFVGALQVERVMMFIILTLIVLVAAMNVVASFTMLVRVKRGSIAILRTMGAGAGTIMRAFFMAAAGVGMVGTAIGTALGLFICANMKTVGRALSAVAGSSAGQSAEVDFVSTLPVRVQVSEVAMIVAIAILLSLAAAAYPAWRSVRVEPVEALRNE